MGQVRSQWMWRHNMWRLGSVASKRFTLTSQQRQTAESFLHNWNNIWPEEITAVATARRVKEEADKERKQAKKLHVASINVYQWFSSQINAFLLYSLSHNIIQQDPVVCPDPQRASEQTNMMKMTTMTTMTMTTMMTTMTMTTMMIIITIMGQANDSS